MTEQVEQTEEAGRLLGLMATGALYGIPAAPTPYWAAATQLGLLQTQTLLAELAHQGLVVHLRAGVDFVKTEPFEPGKWAATEAGLDWAVEQQRREIDRSR